MSPLDHRCLQTEALSIWYCPERGCARLPTLSDGRTDAKELFMVPWRDMADSNDGQWLEQRGTSKLAFQALNTRPEFIRHTTLTTMPSKYFFTCDRPTRRRNGYHTRKS